jgi:hypothetical protein
MTDRDDDDARESPKGIRGIAMREIDDVLDDLDTLLKNNEVGSELSALGVNISLALTAAAGLRAYLHGNKHAAIEDLGTAVEEIAARASVKE